MPYSHHKLPSVQSNLMKFMDLILTIIFVFVCQKICDKNAHYSVQISCFIQSTI